MNCTVVADDGQYANVNELEEQRAAADNVSQVCCVSISESMVNTR